MLRNMGMPMVASAGIAALLCFSGRPVQGQDVSVKFEVGPAKGAVEWKTQTVHENGQDVTYYRAPNELLRAAGLAVRDIPDDQNAALVYWHAFDALSANSLLGPPMAAHRMSEKAPWSAEDGPEFKALYDWFQSTTEARALLHKAAAMKDCEFPCLYMQPEENLSLFGGLQPHLAAMNDAERELAVEAHWFEKQGKLREAFDTYFVMLGMAQHVVGEYFIVSGITGVGCAQVAQRNMLASLENKALDPGTLQWLAQKLEEREKSLPDRAAWVAGEKAGSIQVVRQGLGLPSVFLSRSRVLRILCPDRTLARDYAKYYDWYAGVLKQPPWESDKSLNSGKSWPESAGGKDWNFLAVVMMPMLAPSFARTVSEFDRVAAWHVALEIDVALRRYRLAHGQYPDALDKLSPEFLKELPPDPFSGLPFHYRLENGEWLLYSVGLNRQDDGGVQDPQNNALGDIVFRSRN